MHWGRGIEMLTSSEMMSLGSRFGVRLNALPETFLLSDSRCLVARSLLGARNCIDVTRISGQWRRSQGLYMPVLASLA